MNECQVSLYIVVCDKLIVINWYKKILLAIILMRLETSIFKFSKHYKRKKKNSMVL